MPLSQEEKSKKKELRKNLMQNGFSEPIFARKYTLPYLEKFLIENNSLQSFKEFMNSFHREFDDVSQYIGNLAKRHPTRSKKIAPSKNCLKVLI